jgi:uncharacterized protein HemX
MPTPVVIHVTCPRCGAGVPDLAPGQRSRCPYCKTQLAMPRLDPTRTEMPEVVVADVAGSNRAGGCMLAAVLLGTGVVVAGAIGAAVWSQQRQQAETAQRVTSTLEEVRRAQQSAIDQVNAAQRGARELTRVQRQAACEVRAATACERACRERPEKCNECLPRERAACAAE